MTMTMFTAPGLVAVSDALTDTNRASDTMDGASLLDCRITAELPLLSLSHMARVGGLPVYRLSPHNGPIGFSVSRVGMLAARGTFTGYDGALTVDPDTGRIIAVRVAIRRETMAIEEVDTPLISPSRLNPSEQPQPPLRFRSSAVVHAARDRARLRGLIDIDGTPRLQTVLIEPAGSEHDPITGTAIAAFTLTARVTASRPARELPQVLIGEAVHCTLRLTVELEPAT